MKNSSTAGFSEKKFNRKDEEGRKKEGKFNHEPHERKREFHTKVREVSD
jgi:hypothetical protein